MKEKKLTKFNVFSTVYGGTIGSGIFLMIGFAIGGAGRSLPLAVLLGAIYITMANLYSYIITSMVPLKGGMYDHLAFVGSPTLVGVMALSGVLGATMVTGFATGIVDYLAVIFPGIAPYSKIIAFCIILFFFVLSSFGVETYAKVQNVMTVVLLASLALFAILGLTKVDFGTYFNPEGFFYGGGKGFISAAALMAFTCTGGEGCGFALVGEVDQPTKVIPKYTLLGVFAAVFTYLLMCIVAAGVLPIDQVAYQPLTVVAAEFMHGPLFVVFVIGGAVFALLTSLNSYIIYLKYPMIEAAHDGWLPKAFGKQTKNGYPLFGMVVCFLLGVVPLLFDISFDTIVTLTSIATLPLMILANFACIKLPKQFPELWKKSIFHMPYPVYAVLMTLASLCSCYYMYSYVADYDLTFKLGALAALVVLYGACFLLVKTGKVDIQPILEKKKRVVAEMESYTETV